MKKFYAFLATMLVAMFSFSAMAEDPYVFVGAWNGWDISGAPEFVQPADRTYKIEKIEKNGIMYGGKKLNEIFKKNGTNDKDAYITFEADDVVKPKNRIYLI